MRDSEKEITKDLFRIKEVVIFAARTI